VGALAAAERAGADVSWARSARKVSRPDRYRGIAALDAGQLAHASLDALWPEPLPKESPLWLHPKVTVMPHIARRPTVTQLATEMVANIRSLRSGGGLLEQVDLARGY
jgi:glyoxylate/hydroxypyruvate reductase A